MSPPALASVTARVVEDRLLQGLGHLLKLPIVVVASDVCAIALERFHQGEMLGFLAFVLRPHPLKFAVEGEIAARCLRLHGEEAGDLLNDVTDRAEHRLSPADEGAQRQRAGGEKDGFHESGPFRVVCACTNKP